MNSSYKHLLLLFLITTLNLCPELLFSQNLLNTSLISSSCNNAKVEERGMRDLEFKELNSNFINGDRWFRKDSHPNKNRSEAGAAMSEEPSVRISGHDQTIRWGDRFDEHPVKVYSNCDEAELFVNGASQGVITIDSDNFSTTGFQWNVRFNERGTHLKVVARKNDVVVTDKLDINYQTLQWNEPYRLLPEVAEMNNDTATVLMVLLDKNGVFCPDADNLIVYSLIGDGHLLDTHITTLCNHEIRLSNGSAKIRVKLNGGESMLSVQSEGLPTALISIGPSPDDKANQPDPLGNLELYKTPSEEDVIHYMNLVADWQLENLPERKQRPGSNNPPYWYEHFDWTNASFYTGIMAHWRTTGNKKYFDKMLEFSEEINFQPGTRLLHADDHIIGQIYAEIYMENQELRVIQPMLDTFDKIMETPHVGREIWDWCDALYMAPPTLVLLSKVTGDDKYIDFMDELWWDATDFLYDTDEKLYYRDSRFLIKADGSGRREPDGSKVFWSRGNGWVLGGLARVLDYMPADYHSRERFEDLFRDMSARIANLQMPDGLWRSSLLYPEFNEAGESSGTAFFAYGLAWGVNQGLLCEETYLPYILRSWDGLVNNVHPDGKLGWTQQIGFAPDDIHADMSEVYGAGAFLLAGSELVKYINNNNQASH